MDAKGGRRQEYIDAAAEVFYRRGYDSATIRDLAAELGVTKAAVYYYVDGKEDLLYEIIHEMHVLNLANLEAAKERDGSAIARLRFYFEAHARLNLAYLEKATVVYRDIDYLSEDRRREIVVLRDQTEHFVRDLLGQAVVDGTACELLDVRLASIHMFATVNALYSWYHRSGKMQIDDVARRVADFVVAAIACTGVADRSCPRHNPIG